MGLRVELGGGACLRNLSSSCRDRTGLRVELGGGACLRNLSSSCRDRTGLRVELGGGACLRNFSRWTIIGGVKGWGLSEGLYSRWVG